MTRSPGGERKGSASERKRDGETRRTLLQEPSTWNDEGETIGKRSERSMKGDEVLGGGDVVKAGVEGVGD